MLRLGFGNYRVPEVDRLRPLQPGWSASYFFSFLAGIPLKYLTNLLPQKHVDKIGSHNARQGNKNDNHDKSSSTDLPCLFGAHPRLYRFLIRKKLRWNRVLVHAVAFLYVTS